MISVGNDRRLKVFDVDTMKLVGSLKTKNARFRALALNEDLQRLYASSYEGEIIIFSLKSPTPIILKSFSFGPDYGYVNSL
jgi:WD40 repeat protein